MKPFYRFIPLLAIVSGVLCVSSSQTDGRPVHRAKAKSDAIQAFMRQVNTVSNVEFYYTNTGRLFSAGTGQDEGLFWPRGSGNSYIFGGGLWFATKKAIPNSPEAEEGWSVAAFVDQYTFSSSWIAADSRTGKIFFIAASGGVYSVFVRQDTLESSQVLFTGWPNNLMITSLADVNGTLLIGTSNGLYTGPETGPFTLSTIHNRVAAISPFGVVYSNAIYAMNDTGWRLRGFHPSNATWISSLEGNKTILIPVTGEFGLSEDTGATWDTVPEPQAYRSATLASDGSIVVGTASGILQSSDHGAHWTAHNTGLSDTTVYFLRSDDGVNFVALTKAGVFTTFILNGMWEPWVNRTPTDSWRGSVKTAMIDASGAVHLLDSAGALYTQWHTKTLIPGSVELCDVGYNPNSGAGWYTPGEFSQLGLDTGTDGANLNSKYVSYVSPRYDSRTGVFIPNSSDSLTAPYYNWPLWDTSTSNAFLHNYYFGDYISDVHARNADSLSRGNHTAVPAITSQEDILNLYTDADTTANPEFVAGTGYPFGLDIQEELYTWGFGVYQNIIFLRYKIKNALSDTLKESWLALALDPDLDAAFEGAADDANSYLNDSLAVAMADPAMLATLGEPFRSDPALLNMAVQWRNVTQPPEGQQYGMFGASVVESPTIGQNGQIIPNDDSAALGGYGPNSLFAKNQLGLSTFRGWNILNDPEGDPERYAFLSSGEKDIWNGVYQDQRMMLASGPFNLAPGQSAEVTYALIFARASDTDYKKNFGALLLEAELAHNIFAQVDSDGAGHYSVNHFRLSPQDAVQPRSPLPSLSIGEPYPNPFSNTCTVQYQCATAGEVTAMLSDMLGRTVESFQLGTVPAGTHTLTLDGSALAGGAYRLVISIGSQSVSEALVHIP